MFERYAAGREVEQRKIERAAAIAGDEDDERRTTLSLSLVVDDKRRLKPMAAQRDTTITALVHGWIAEHAEEERR